MTKKTYSPDQQFMVVVAINSREKTFERFRLEKITNEVIGLHDTIVNNPELSDGEIAENLLIALEKLYGDGYKYNYISLINWWPM